MTDLKPCPFCGGQAGEIRPTKPGRFTKAGYVLGHWCNYFTFYVTALGDTADEVAEAWNRRAEND